MAGRDRRRGGEPAPYLRALFSPDETVAILTVPRGGQGGVEQRFPTVRQASRERYLAFLRHRNATGHDVYVSVNPIDPTRRRREKQDVAAVRRLQLDIDDNGPASLRRLMADVQAGKIPQPAHVLESSRERYQVLWNCRPESWTPDQAETLMCRLAAKYGGDQAATDISRVMRLPGFRNKKDGREDALCTWRHTPGEPAQPGDFHDLPEHVEALQGGGQARPRDPSAPLSRSEHDWAWTRDQLRKGVDPADVEAELRRERQDKPNPTYYARRTVQRALLSLERDALQRRANLTPAGIQGPTPPAGTPQQEDREVADKPSGPRRKGKGRGKGKQPRKNWKADQKKKMDAYSQNFADQIIKQIEAGVAPWQKPWKPGDRALPENLQSGKTYRGGNSLYLSMVQQAQGYGDNRWATFKQIKKEGGHVRKGEKGTHVLFVDWERKKARRDEQGKIVKDDKGKTVFDVSRRDFPAIRTYVVFNVEQAQGLNLERPDTPAETWQAEEKAENLIAASGVPMRHVNGDQAYYTVGKDLVTMPEKHQFPDACSYYQTALHELGHATGHESRLNRETLTKHPGFRSEAYAKEELRAEIGAMMTGTRIGVGHDPRQGAAYVKSWVKVLKEEPREIQRAAADAQQMSNYLVDRARTQEKEVAQPVDQLRQAGIQCEPGAKGGWDCKAVSKGADLGTYRTPAEAARVLTGDRADVPPEIQTKDTRLGGMEYHHWERTAVVEAHQGEEGHYRVSMAERRGDPPATYKAYTDRLEDAERVARGYAMEGIHNRHADQAITSELLREPAAKNGEDGREQYETPTYYGEDGRRAEIRRLDDSGDGREQYDLRLVRNGSTTRTLEDSFPEAQRVAVEFTAEGREPSPINGGNGAGWSKTYRGEDGRAAEVTAYAAPKGRLYEMTATKDAQHQDARLYTTIQEAETAAESYAQTGQIPERERGGSPLSWSKTYKGGDGRQADVVMRDAAEGKLYEVITYENEKRLGSEIHDDVGDAHQQATQYIETGESPDYPETTPARTWTPRVEQQTPALERTRTRDAAPSR